MSLETLFTICNTSVLPFWILLVFFPRWKGTRLLVHSMAVPMVLAVVYTVLLAQGIFGGEGEGGDFSSLAGVMALFAVPQGALAGWVHYLVFDLFIGAWEGRDAQRLGIPHLAVAPCMFLTLMAGPFGLLLYFLLRWFVAKRFVIEVSESAGA